MDDMTLAEAEKYAASLSADVDDSQREGYLSEAARVLLAGLREAKAREQAARPVLDAARYLLEIGGRDLHLVMPVAAGRLRDTVAAYDRAALGGSAEADEPLHEWACPSCGATTRARMADAAAAPVSVAGEDTRPDVTTLARRLHALLRNGKDMWDDADGEQRRYYEHVVRLFLAEAGTPVVGRCGASSSLRIPLTTRSSCELPAGHAGFHRDGQHEWGRVWVDPPETDDSAEAEPFGECTALCRDVEEDRDQLASELAAARPVLDAALALPGAVSGRKATDALVAAVTAYHRARSSAGFGLL